MTTLKFGEMVSGVVERQTAHFYKINVSESDMKNGIIVNCVSNGGDKFKVVFFDKVCFRKFVTMNSNCNEYIRCFTNFFHEFFSVCQFENDL